jgi:hypothetical protein
MAKTLPFRLGIDHDRKMLRMRVQNSAGKYVQANIDAEQLAEFMTILSHCQHALVLSKAGHVVNLPIDPRMAFEPEVGPFLLGAYEGVQKLSAGIDEQTGTVGLLILSPSGRLSGFRIIPETARALGEGLVDAAEKMPGPPKIQ